MLILPNAYISFITDSIEITFATSAVSYNHNSNNIHIHQTFDHIEHWDNIRDLVQLMVQYETHKKVHLSLKGWCTIRVMKMYEIVGKLLFELRSENIFRPVYAIGTKIELN